MYAVIEESGGQRRVTDGEEILIDLLKGGESAEGEAVTFDKVLLLGDAGGAAKIGQPYIAGASVSAEVVTPVVLGDKIHVQKFKPKKTYKRKTGHRQRYTCVRISAITG